jgi:thiamine biosynthesis lipoprotein
MRLSNQYNPLIALCIIAACVVLAACGARSTLAEFHGNTMGTTYLVKIADIPPSLDSSTLHAEIQAVFVRINNQMSTYLESSTLSRFNAGRETDWFNVPMELVTVVQQARQLSELTGGAFDVTVGPLVNLWGFGPEAASEQPPHAEAIASALQRIGYRKLDIRMNPPGLKKSSPDLYVDLSAIAKGYAVDQVAEHLEERGISNYLVEVGGEIRGLGQNARHVPWQVAIEKPVPGTRIVQQVIAIDGVSIATSGDYRNYFEHEGRQFSHTIDPKTGAPVTHALASVTVVNPSAAYADGLATGLMVLGPDAGYQLAEREGLAALFIVRTAGDFAGQATPAFDRYSKEQRS